MKTSVHSKFSTNTENRDTKVAVTRVGPIQNKTNEPNLRSLEYEKFFSVHKRSYKIWWVLTDCVVAMVTFKA